MPGSTPAIFTVPQSPLPRSHLVQAHQTTPYHVQFKTAAVPNQTGGDKAPVTIWISLSKYADEKAITTHDTRLNSGKTYDMRVRHVNDRPAGPHLPSSPGQPGVALNTPPKGTSADAQVRRESARPQQRRRRPTPLRDPTITPSANPASAWGTAVPAHRGKAGHGTLRGITVQPPSTERQEVGLRATGPAHLHRGPASPAITQAAECRRHPQIKRANPRTA